MFSLFYTGSVSQKLTQFKNVYLRYMLYGEKQAKKKVATMITLKLLKIFTFSTINTLFSLEFPKLL